MATKYFCDRCNLEFSLKTDLQKARFVIVYSSGGKPEELANQLFPDPKEPNKEFCKKCITNLTDALKVAMHEDSKEHISSVDFSKKPEKPPTVSIVSPP